VAGGNKTISVAETRVTSASCGSGGGGKRAVLEGQAVSTMLRPLSLA